jgi:drug/metabolite transporter (DMT)-like permease
MRTLGIILLVLGIVMMIVNGFNFRTKENVADIGPLEINKTETKKVTWPTYAGAAVTIAGVVLLAVGRKKD